MSVVLRWPRREPQRPLTDIDLRVGRNLRALRRARGLSPRQLAERLSRTVGQLLAMEVGSRRVAARDMFELAQILKTSIGSFYAIDRVPFLVVPFPTSGLVVGRTHDVSASVPCRVGVDAALGVDKISAQGTQERLGD